MFEGESTVMHVYAYSSIHLDTVADSAETISVSVSTFHFEKRSEFNVSSNSQLEVTVHDVSPDTDKKVDIKPVGSYQKQTLSEGTLTPWEFVITPLRAGDFTLLIKPSIEGPGTETLSSIPAIRYEGEIQSQVIFIRLKK